MQSSAHTKKFFICDIKEREKCNNDIRKVGGVENFHVLISYFIAILLISFYFLIAGKSTIISPFNHMNSFEDDDDLRHEIKGTKLIVFY